MQLSYKDIYDIWSCGNLVYLFEDNYDSSGVTIEANSDVVSIDVNLSHEGGSHILSREEAIAAAKAILKHFGET